MAGRGAILRARREALGLSVDELSVATRIPVEHLCAIEDDRLHDVPKGPYAAAYQRTLAHALDVPEADPNPDPHEPPDPTAGAPLWVVRALATSSVVALLGLVAWQLWQQTSPPTDIVPPPIEPDQVVEVKAQRNTHVRLVVDGEVAVDRSLPGGESVEVAGHERIEVDVPSMADVRIRWNGVSVSPQGRQDAPRRLVFVDDVGPSP